MTTISQQQFVIDLPRAGPTSARYTLWGKAIGAFAGLATLFAVSAAYALTKGYGALDCAAFGSIVTLLLSRPTVLAGHAVGAACGEACAFVAHLVHRPRSSG